MNFKKILNFNNLSSNLYSLGFLTCTFGFATKFLYKVEPGERVIIFDKFIGGI